MATAINRFALDNKQTVEQAIESGGPLLRKVRAGLSDQGEPVAAAAERAPADEIEEKPDPVFTSWFQTEAKLVDSTKVDLKAKETELEKIARSITDKEVRYLQRTSMDPASPQVERILSTYLLTRGGDVTQRALVDIASRPLSLSPAEAHSLQEIENNKERAINIMAIDSIAESSINLSERIRLLQEIIQKSQDASVKNYAQRKQDDLQKQ